MDAVFCRDADRVWGMVMEIVFLSILGKDSFVRPGLVGIALGSPVFHGSGKASSASKVVGRKLGEAGKRRVSVFGGVGLLCRFYTAAGFGGSECER